MRDVNYATKQRRDDDSNERSNQTSRAEVRCRGVTDLLLNGANKLTEEPLLKELLGQLLRLIGGGFI